MNLYKSGKLIRLPKKMRGRARENKRDRETTRQTDRRTESRRERDREIENRLKRVTEKGGEGWRKTVAVAIVLYVLLLVVN